MTTHFQLNTGATIPALGLGTWQSGPGEVQKAVSHALANGYTHVDGAVRLLSALWLAYQADNSAVLLCQ